jgi:hypothetical protein
VLVSSYRIQYNVVPIASLRQSLPDSDARSTWPVHVLRERESETGRIYLANERSAVTL